MVDSADQARKIAARAGAALKLVNETAAAALIDAASQGETRVRIDIEPVALPMAAGRIGRLYEHGLIEALEQAGEDGLARACRMFMALGFAIGAAPDVEREQDIDRVGDVVRSIRIDHLELGFATAMDFSQGARPPLLHSVALPAAHLWRARAEATRVVAQYERKALASIASRAERGADSCRLPWRDFGSGAVNAEHMQRLGEALRRRGFRVEIVDSGATLRVNW